MLENAHGMLKFLLFAWFPSLPSPKLQATEGGGIEDVEVVELGLKLLTWLTIWLISPKQWYSSNTEKLDHITNMVKYIVYL